MVQSIILDNSCCLCCCCIHPASSWAKSILHWKGSGPFIADTVPWLYSLALPVMFTAWHQRGIPIGKRWGNRRKVMSTETNDVYPICRPEPLGKYNFFSQVINKTAGGMPTCYQLWQHGAVDIQRQSSHDLTVHTRRQHRRWIPRCGPSTTVHPQMARPRPLAGAWPKQALCVFLTKRPS
jgi:hypothetical protein